MKYVTVWASAPDKSQMLNFDIIEYGGNKYLRVFLDFVDAWTLLISLEPFYTWDSEALYFYCIELDNDQGVIRDFISLDSSNKPDIEDRKQLASFVRDVWNCVKRSIWMHGSVYQKVMNGITYCDDLSLLSQIKNGKVIDNISPDGYTLSSRCLKELDKMVNRKDAIIKEIKEHSYGNVN